MKHIVAIAMSGMFIILCVLLVTESSSITNEYETYINQAKAEEKKGLYLNAINYYQSALEVYDEDQNVKYQIVKDYKNMGNIEGWLDTALLFIKNYPAEADKAILIDAYNEVLSYYYENKEYDALVPMLSSLRGGELAKSNKDFSKKIEDYYYNISSVYTTIKWEAEYLSDFYNGYFTMSQNNGKDKYLVSGSGSIYNEKAYEDICILDDVLGYSLVKEDGIYKVYTTGGYLKEIDQDGITDARYYSSSYIAGKKDGKYRMYKSDFSDAGFGGWDSFQLIAPGIACVTDGGKDQILVGSKILEPEEGDNWDSVIYSQRGIKENGNQLFVGNGGSYKLISIDTDKTEYTTLAKGFEAADAFCTTEPAAVKKDGKWGFISVSGEIVIEPVYEEAKSFSYGYAPVKKDGKWTLVDTSGKEILDADFADMGSPTENGIVPVSFDGNTWDLVSLFIKNYQD